MILPKDYARFVSMLVLQDPAVVTWFVASVGSEREGVAEGILFDARFCTDAVGVVSLRLAVVLSEYWSPASSSYASRTVSAHIQPVAVPSTMNTYILWDGS